MSFKIYTPNRLDILEVIINDINHFNLTEILFWTPIEHDLPGDGNFVDNGTSFGKLIQIINDREIRFYILFGSEINQIYYSKYHHKNIKLLEWPTSLLHFTFEKLNNTIIYKNNEFENLFVCLNNRSHTHRAKLIDKIYQNNLFQHGKISWLQSNDELNNYTFQFWKEEKIILDNGGHNNFYFDSKCFLDIVTESTNSKLFISEKTFKPIIYEQPFLCLGHQNQNITLEKYGFKIYDEIFDYEFDCQISIDDRIDGIIRNINKIKNHNLLTLDSLLKDKVEYNKNNALHILEKDSYISKEIHILFEKYNDEFHRFQEDNKDMMMKKY